MSTECSGRLPFMHQCVFYRWAHIPHVKKPVVFGNRRMICQMYDWIANYKHKFLTEENIRYFKMLKSAAIQIFSKTFTNKSKTLITYNDSFWSLLYKQPLPTNSPPKKKPSTRLTDLEKTWSICYCQERLKLVWKAQNTDLKFPVWLKQTTGITYAESTHTE